MNFIAPTRFTVTLAPFGKSSLLAIDRSIDPIWGIDRAGNPRGALAPNVGASACLDSPPELARLADCRLKGLSQQLMVFCISAMPETKMLLCRASLLILRAR